MNLWSRTNSTIAIKQYPSTPSQESARDSDSSSDSGDLSSREGRRLKAKDWYRESCWGGRGSKWRWCHVPSRISGWSRRYRRKSTWSTSFRCYPHCRRHLREAIHHKGIKKGECLMRKAQGTCQWKAWGHRRGWTRKGAWKEHRYPRVDTWAIWVRQCAMGYLSYLRVRQVRSMRQLARPCWGLSSKLRCASQRPQMNMGGSSC